MASKQEESPWYAAYPAARTKQPAQISRAELLQLIKDGQVAGKDFVLIDMRRMDYEVSMAYRYHDELITTKYVPRVSRFA